MSKRASYLEGVAWIALNDEPAELDVATVAGQISTCLLADLFDKDQYRVALDVVVFREREASR